MRKLLFSLAAILVLLVLVSCPDGMIPTSVLDIALTMSEDSEIKLEQFEKLNYTVKEVESGKEITQEFSTIENIKVPVVTTGEYVISVTGVTEDDNYTYTCSGSETVTVTENQATKVEIILKTTKVVKEATISLSFDNKIEKSDEYDLEIAKVAYVVTALDKETKGESTSNSISLTITKEVSELNYTLTAYNASGVEIGYGEGKITVENGVDKYSATILEKEGEGTLIVSVTKDSDAEFPPITIGDTNYTVTALENSETEGSASINLKNGKYSVLCGEKSIDIRIVNGQKKSLSFNFATPLIPVSFVDNIVKDSEYNLKIAKIDCSFPSLDEKYSVKGVDYTDKLSVSIPKIVGEVSYEITAYNSESKVIGEGSGIVKIEENTESISLNIDEKSGSSTISFNLSKRAEEDFPEIKVGDQVVEITVAEDGKSGSGSIILDNGTYDIFMGSLYTYKDFRVVAGVDRTIEYDFTDTYIYVRFDADIDASSEYNLAVTSLSYSFTSEGGEEVSDEKLSYPADYIKLEKKDWNYKVDAFNSDGDVIGEASGSISSSDYEFPSIITVKEKEGKGTLVVSAVKDYGKEFPKVTIGDDEYTITLNSDSDTEGKVSIDLQNGNYTVICGDNSEDIRIVAGKTKELSFNFENPFVLITFKDEIEKSEEYNLDIATIDYTFPELESEYSAKGVEFKEDMTISIPKLIGNVEYNVVAYNSEKVAVGETSGSLTIDKNSEKLSVAIKEKEGEGTIIFNLTKDEGNVFPVIKVGDKVVEIKISEDNTAGTGSISLKNGVYDIYVDGTVKESVRIIQGVKKTISYDYTRRLIDFKFSVDVDQENAEGLNLELDHISFELTKSDGKIHKGTIRKDVIAAFSEDNYDYLFEAVNSDGIAFAEAKGKVLVSECDGLIVVVLKEKKGNGNLVVNCTKSSSNDFPVLKVDGIKYTFEESSKTEGSVTITLPNGLYTVVCGGEEKTVRIAVDQTNTINYDFSFTPMPVEVIDSIPKYDGYDMEIAKVSYYFEKDGEVIKSDDATFDEFKALTFKKTGKDVWNYEVKAYNKVGVQIGEASGRYLFAYQKDSFEIELKEKIGEGTIKIVLTVPEEVEFPEVKVEDVSVLKEEFTKEDNVYTYSVNEESGEYVVSIGNSKKTVRVVSGMDVVLSADYSTGIDVNIKNDIVVSGYYDIEPNPNNWYTENQNYFYVTCGGDRLSDESGISVKWIMNGKELESTSTEITFKEGELALGPCVLYAYIYEGDKLLDIASKLFTVESISNEEV